MKSIKDSYFKTGVQEIEFFSDAIDMAYDFIMVYGFHRDLEKRIKSFKDQGYMIHFMTGLSWGAYQDYFHGHFDGVKHHEEAQHDKEGKPLLHGVDVPYIVPTYTFTSFLIEKLKKVVDLGVSHIHLEEPEFFQHAGYSKAFQELYAIYMKKPFEAPHTYDDFYQHAKLKAYIFTKMIEDIARTIKQYGMRMYQRYIYVYIPTHSLLNYTQWQIISPESKLAQIKEIDGFIGQVWAGTSKVQNRYHNIKKERTFETAFLEYGIVSGLDPDHSKTMWFLNDPIEDNPGLTWDNYRYDYLRTLTASLLHPNINLYEICPWPTRVFNRKLPRVEEKKLQTIEPTFIPKDYDILLNNTFQMLHDMPLGEKSYEGIDFNIGMFLSDTSMYQKQVPKDETNEINHFKVSIEFPDYFGITLPLLKAGLPLMGYTLDHVSSYPTYLDDLDIVLLSYDMMKPESPDLHVALKRFVLEGKTLIYVGDDKDPFHQINHWWHPSYPSPRMHLFETLGVDLEDTGYEQVGHGYVGYYKIEPHVLATDPKEADLFLNFVEELIHSRGFSFEKKNYIKLKRGPYVIISYMQEAAYTKELPLEGAYLNMLKSTCEVLENPLLTEGEVYVLYDLNQAKNLDVLLKTYRTKLTKIHPMVIEVSLQGKKHIDGLIVIKLDKEPINIMNSSDYVPFTYDSKHQLLTIHYVLKERVDVLYIHL